MIKLTKEQAQEIKGSLYILRAISSHKKNISSANKNYKLLEKKIEDELS